MIQSYGRISASSPSPPGRLATMFTLQNQKSTNYINPLSYEDSNEAYGIQGNTSQI